MTTPPQAIPPVLADALARLWTKFLPEIERRLAVLEDAAQALREGSLSAELRAAAHADAHKLAGSLGTFGLQRGTELARRAELLLAEEIPEGNGENGAAEHLTAWTGELRMLLASQK